MDAGNDTTLFVIGAVLLGIGLALVIAEIFLGVAVVGIAGAVALIVGAILFIDNAPVDSGDAPLWTLSTIVAVAVVIVGGISILVLRDRRRPARDRTWDVAAIVGKAGIAKSALDPDGTVLVASELWSARAAGTDIAKDAQVRVVEVEGMTAVVEPVEPGPQPDAPTETAPS